MSRYRTQLPQLSSDLFLTDGGLETTLVFHEGIDLPCFAAFTLLDREGGREHLERYYALYAGIAQDKGLGAVFDSATWRASADWGRELGYDARALEDANRRSIEVMAAVRERVADDLPLVIGASMGPRADGYQVEKRMSDREAEAYHAAQVRAFVDTEADFVSALTLNYVEEAIGIARAAEAAGMPAVLSFTVETDGRLPSGQGLGEAIEAVDAATGAYAAYYMVNCAHPTHFVNALRGGEPWIDRLRGIRANASRKSHAELDEAEELDDGNPVELGCELAALRSWLPHVNVLGGCCGTDHRHVAQIARACTALAR